MMKKLTAVLLAVLLLMPLAFAEEKGAVMLEAAEVQEMFSAVLSQLIAEDSVEVWDEDGTTCMGRSACYLTLREGDELTYDAEVLSCVLIGREDARGISAGDPLENVLEAYPCDNPSLRGTEYSALIYMYGDLAQDGTVLTGFCSRDGQKNDSVTYMSLTLGDEGVYCFGVRYDTEADAVTGIEYFKNTMEKDEADALLNELAESQEIGTFEPAISVSGADAAVFGTEDLIFSGISMTVGTPDELLALLGNTEVDTRITDPDGSELRVMQWDGAEAVALYSADGAFEKLYSLRVTGTLPGPRGILCGESVRSVRNRFCHEEETGLLYGNGTDLPYGVLTTVDNAILIRYAADANGSQATLALRFEEGVLCEILITMD